MAPPGQPAVKGMRRLLQMQRLLELCSGEELIPCLGVLGTGLGCPLPLRRGLLALGLLGSGSELSAPCSCRLGSRGGCWLAGWARVGCSLAAESVRVPWCRVGLLVVGSDPTGLLQPCAPPGMGASMEALSLSSDFLSRRLF